MEVHPPHEPVHSWRDALIHIGLMTIGLFIALSLEGLIEYVHHKHLVHEARENIRRELQENHHNAQQDIVYLQQSADRITAGINTLKYIEAHRDATHQSIAFSLEFSVLSDAAWRTARDTGALGYMPLDEVQTYASLYGLQANISDQAGHLVVHQAEALAPIFAATDNPDFDKMSAADFAEMRKAAGANYADVTVLRQFLQQLDKQYVDTLKPQ